jgi:CubicO group peptidase (beta-lactamase class C family)
MPNGIDRRRFLAGCAAGLYAAALPRPFAAQNKGGAPPPPPPADCKKLLDSLTTNSGPLMKKHSVPGMAAALVVDGRVVWANGFGLRNVETKSPVEVGTVFEVGALSKAVVAYAVLKMGQEKLIDLDTPLDRYLPPESFRRNRLAGIATARQVLAGGPSAAASPKSEAPLNGFSLLQALIEKVSGKSFSVYMGASVFQPLGMNDSSFTWLSNYERSAATGYEGKYTAGYTLREQYRLLTEGRSSPGKRFRRLSDKQRATFKRDYLKFLKIPEAVGGLYSSVGDVCRFLIAVNQMTRRQGRPPAGNNKAAMFGKGGVMEKSAPAQTKVEALNASLVWGRGQGPGGTFVREGNLRIFRSRVIVTHGGGLVLMANGVEGGRLFDELVPAGKFGATC